MEIITKAYMVGNDDGVINETPVSGRDVREARALLALPEVERGDEVVVFWPDEDTIDLMSRSFAVWCQLIEDDDANDDDDD